MMKFLTRDLLREGKEALADFRANMEKIDRRLRVLIVDNDPMDVELLVRSLAPYNVDVDVASNGQQAVEKLESLHYDFMLLDMKLNGFSGVDVLRECVKLAIRVPTIVLTGAYSDDSPEADESCKLGALFVVHKPLNEDQLNAIFLRP